MCLNSAFYIITIAVHICENTCTDIQFFFCQWKLYYSYYCLGTINYHVGFVGHMAYPFHFPTLLVLYFRFALKSEELDIHTLLFAFSQASVNVWKSLYIRKRRVGKYSAYSCTYFHLKVPIFQLRNPFLNNLSP